jgi:UDP-N-acetyl-D-mannosaminuronic acid transferase (WecB/TagA/CpsF family)
MTRLFNVNFEFNKSIVNEKVAKNIKTQSKGYVCVVDGNVLSNTYIHSSYNNIINNSLLNICDGSSTALLGNLIYKTKYKTYVGSVGAAFDFYSGNSTYRCPKIIRKANLEWLFKLTKILAII